MSSTYEIMKKAYFLSRQEKEFLFDNLDDILAIPMDHSIKVGNRLKRQKDVETKKKELVEFKDSKIPKIKEISEDPSTAYTVDEEKVPRNYSHLKGDQDSDSYHQHSLAIFRSLLKEGKKFHDPETKDQIEALIEKMEKFISVDSDISYGNICVFLHPLCKGARRVSIRQFQIVGLCRRLNQLSRSFEQAMRKGKKRDANTLRRQFNSVLSEIKTKLKDPKSKPVKKLHFKVVNAQLEKTSPVLENGIKLMLHQGMSPEDIKNRIIAMSGMLDFKIDENMINDAINHISQGV